MTERVHVVVTGRVQGVFFRVTCAREARARGVAGWVRNREDGAVEAVFEGDPGPVGELVTWCRTGPGGADVTRIEVRTEAPQGVAGFEIVG